MMERLQNILAHAGVASRRGAAALIESGVVTVDGIVVKEPGARFDEGVRIKVNGKEISAEEKQLYVDVKNTYLARMKTKCTGCEYCQPCPRGVKIPNIFQGYDRSLLQANGSFKGGYAKLVEQKADASLCVNCRKCERACPQHLPIRDLLKKVSELYDDPSNWD